jgi:cell division protein FtsI (penicillin-binding protein 3)
MNNSRALIVLIFVFLFFAALIIKLFDIQIVKSEELKYYAKRQQTKLEDIKADRGLIYDRNNILLVYNQNDVSFYVDLRMATEKSKREIADKFSSLFGKSKSYYMNLMNPKGKNVCIEKKVPGEEALPLKNFKVTGLFSQEDPTRVYQYDNLASHVLGYVNSDYTGVNGVEESLNSLLKGDNGKRLVERDAVGDMITVSEGETIPAHSGDNIYLTINKIYQNILEEELKKGVETYKGTSATGIIMNPNNGEILALANIDDYDPQDYWKYTDAQRRDRALTDTYEPGSTFKGISLSALLNQNLVKLTDVVSVDNGIYKLKGVYIKDTHPFKYLTVRGVIEQSSNVGMSKLIQKIDDDTYYKYLRAFGFGNYTSIDLPGEAKGTLKNPSDWSEITKEFMSFGYGLSVTPLQLIVAYCAVINGGILYQPQIIKKEVDPDGTVIFEDNPKEVRRVISEHTSALMRNVLVSVVENGTGQNAKLSYIKIGGKTGTSQKLINGSYSSESYNSSFIGFFPADNPQIICLVLVNSPQIGRYGGSVAAPIFKNVAERIISSGSDNFQDEQKDTSNLKYANTANSDVKPNFINAVQKSENKNLEKTKPSSNIMPDLTNYSLREAIYELARLGIKYKVQGSGKIVSQSIQAGEKIEKGSECILTCKENSLNGVFVY